MFVLHKLYPDYILCSGISSDTSPEYSKDVFFTEELAAAYFSIIIRTAAARPMLLSSALCHSWTKIQAPLGPLNASSGS